jgi:hypothetical protein
MDEYEVVPPFADIGLEFGWFSDDVRVGDGSFTPAGGGVSDWFVCAIVAAVF